MGLFSLAFAGGGLVLIGAWESLSAPHKPTPLRHSSVSLLGAAALSLLLLLSSLLSLLDALHSHDTVGAALALQSLPVFALFLLFSLLALFTRLPYPLLNFILLLAFLQEFLLFYLQRKDPSGVENRYFDIMLIPVSICLFSTIIELNLPESNAPRIARGIGLILHGTWLIQMGFSFFSTWIPTNCTVHYKSSGNYTIHCKGHMDDHRAKAIAVLLFNCQLAFLLSLIVGVYSVVAVKNGKDHTRYRPLEANLQMANQTQFTLDSDEEDLDNAQIKGNANAMDN